MKILKSKRGQATIEYMFVFIFIALIGLRLMDGFRDFFGKSFGNLAHVLSINLQTGICQDHCFYSGYKNSWNKE